MNPSIAFVGGGNMAQALLGALMSQAVAATNILVIDPDPLQLQRVRDVFGVQTSATPEGMLSGASLVVWAVKPQVLRAAATAVAQESITALHVSVVAGIRVSDLARWLCTPRVVRAMPNTPALVRSGVTALHAMDVVSTDDRRTVEALFREVGRTFWVHLDQQMDAVTALSGSGPAYVFHFLEHLQQAAIELGFEQEMARDLSLWVAHGAVQQATTVLEPFAELRQRVTSPGGTTEAALQLLQRRGAGEALVSAVRAAAARARELGRKWGDGNAGS